VVGEDRNAKVVYLLLTSRLLDEPVSAAIKGASASGKSKTVQTTLKFFPKSSYVEMTAMSERALVYMKEDFAHRTLVLFEAVALREGREKAEGNLTAYFVRSLLSEGRISYQATQKDKGTYVAKTIEKNGPTNMIVTTTAIRVHDENETRILSLPTNDSAAQTKAVMLQLAEGSTTCVDYAEWHELQSWLEVAEHRVVIPYARSVAEKIPPVAVRLRRDFGAFLNLIRAHAILQQESRERDGEGRIIASEEDYQVVRDLVGDLIADGVEATVSSTIRETVEAVRALASGDGVSVRQVADQLQLDRSAAFRRLSKARERGFITNREERRGLAARYEIGDPMPEEQPLLPHSCTPPEDETAGQSDSCTGARESEGMEGDEVATPPVAPTVEAAARDPARSTRAADRAPIDTSVRIYDVLGHWTWEPIAGWDAIGIHLPWNQHGSFYRTRRLAEEAASLSMGRSPWR
jgi:hypothetical protein